ncbi:MAG TPA: hypothetical protein VKS22_00860 [Candidatus Binataceae bacterium]|nr:hypothetical protein [Candidatus Binataceae bacterium]
MRLWILAATSLLGMALLTIVLARAQEPSPSGAPTVHVPIKWPAAAPSGWPAELWEKYHKRCQEVADLSAANAPMDSSDYGFAGWCTKQGVYYSPVKQLPRAVITPTPVVTPGPDGHIPISLPESLPPEVNMQPDQWVRVRAECQRIADANYQHVPLLNKDMPPEAAKSAAWNSWRDCAQLYALMQEIRESRERQMSGSPMPTDTPPPPDDPRRMPPPVLPSESNDSSGPQSLNTNSSIGPFGPNFVAGGGDACNTGQPPDVATDVSSTQFVELLNEGIWVFNKTGTVQAGFPQSLATFWAANSPPAQNELTDTQIAFEPLSQRWLATTLSIQNPSAPTDGDLYFAISNTSDATQGWTEYVFNHFCSVPNPAFPFPDQPILGYNQDWAVIGVSCFSAGGTTADTNNDELLLIPHSALATHPANLHAIPELGPSDSNGWFGTRPSRDVSGTAGQNMLLVASGPFGVSGAFKFVKVKALNSSGNIVGVGPGNTELMSPTNGVASDFYFAQPFAEHDTCTSGSCRINLFDSRISNAPVLQTGNDSKHYLLTSFHTSDDLTPTDQNDDLSQALWFVAQTDSFATTPLWNERFMYNSNTQWAAYPTITMDQDLDIALTNTFFIPGTNIFENWYAGKWYAQPSIANPAYPLLGSGVLNDAKSVGGYTGQQTCLPSLPAQRWGDLHGDDVGSVHSRL